MIPRIIIAGTKSGCGKTMVTCALLQMWKRTGRNIFAYKSGPDYIDPMFHSHIIGTKSGNLDLFFQSSNEIYELLNRNYEKSALTIIEGAMGLYDGIAMTEMASAWELACITKTPIILVVDARGSAVSLCAEISGFIHFKPDSGIKAVLLNQVSPMLYPSLKAVIEERCRIPILGFLPKLPQCEIQSRHLGLLTADEIENIKNKLDILADAAGKYIDTEAIEHLANDAPELESNTNLEVPEKVLNNPIVAVARDEAFCFYYSENLACIRRCGGTIVYFSPLIDEKLPECDALYLGGGYPELYAKQLSENASLREDILRKIGDGLPTIAECGGFLYLLHELEDNKLMRYKMCGLFDESGVNGGRLKRFGYITLTAQKDTMLLKKGESVPAHEFHYWDCVNAGADFWGQKPLSQRGWACAYGTETLYAGFPHLYFSAYPKMITRYLDKAVAYKKGKK